MSQASASPLASIALRGGSSLDVWSDRVVADGRSFPLAELTGAAPVADPATPAGTPPRPAIALRGRDGQWITYVPADPPDAQRALDTIYARRPDLRVPTMSAGAPYPPAPQSRPSGSDTILAGIAHLSIFYAPLLLPLIIWLAAQQSAPYASRQAKQAFFFHIGLIALAVLFVAVLFAATVATTAGSVLAGDNRGVGLGVLLFLFGGLLLVIGELVGVAYSIYGAIEAFQGHPFAYPFLGRL